MPSVFLGKNKSIVAKCSKAWTSGTYYKTFIAVAKSRVDKIAGAVILTEKNKDYLKANQTTVQMDRAQMIELYTDAVSEQTCVNQAPACDEVEKAKLACADRAVIPDDFVEIAAKHEITCKKLLSDKVGCCDNAWYQREGQLMGFLESSNENLAAACGL